MISVIGNYYKQHKALKIITEKGHSQKSCSPAANTNDSFLGIRLRVTSWETLRGIGRQGEPSSIR